MAVVDVLIDKTAGDLSIVSLDDFTQGSVEATLSVEEAWRLVTDLNKAIQQLRPDTMQSKLVTKMPKAIHTRYPYSTPDSFMDSSAKVRA